MKKLNNIYFKATKRNSLKIYLILFCLFTSLQIHAQIVKQNRFIQNYQWKVTLQSNIMDTNFGTDKPINTENWSSLPYPSKITVERKLFNNLGLELGYSINKIKKGKVVNGNIANDNLDVFSIDGMFKYNLGSLLRLPVIDPYLGVGMGYMELNQENKTTFNFGGGLNLWIADLGIFKDYVYTRDLVINRFGLNIEAIAKKNLHKGIGSNVQFSAGIFYVF